MIFCRFYFHIVGEAKRRKELGLPPRAKSINSQFPTLDKKAIQLKVKSFLYKNPIIPYVFYGSAIAALIWAVFNLIKVYKLI